MGNTKTKIKTVELDVELYKKNPFCGQPILVTNSKEEIYSFQLSKDERLTIDFKNNRATINNDVLVTNIFCHKYYNLFHDEYNCFLIRGKQLTRFYFIRGNKLHSSIFEIETENIDEYTLNELVSKSFTVFVPGTFIVDNDKLNRVKINSGIKR